MAASTLRAASLGAANGNSVFGSSPRQMVKARGASGVGVRTAVAGASGVGVAARPNGRAHPASSRSGVAVMARAWRKTPRFAGIRCSLLSCAWSAPDLILLIDMKYMLQSPFTFPGNYLYITRIVQLFSNCKGL